MTKKDKEGLRLAYIRTIYSYTLKYRLKINKIEKDNYEYRVWIGARYYPLWPQGEERHGE